MNEIVKREKLLHHAASVVGGFWGAYTIFNHTDIFGNAQTGNLLHMVIELAHGRLAVVGLMLIGFFLYCGGCVFYVLVRRKSRLSMKIVSLICSAAAVALTGLISAVENDIIACYPIIFVAPIQWNAFKIAGGNSSSTIFSSNNVRQAAILTTEYALSRDKTTGGRAGFYWVTLLSFHLGAAVAVGCSLWCGANSIWFCYLPIALTAFAYYRYKSEKLRVAKLVNRKKEYEEK